MLLKREHKAAATALPGREGRSWWRGAFVRRGVMKGGRLCGRDADELCIL